AKGTYDRDFKTITVSSSSLEIAIYLEDLYEERSASSKITITYKKRLPIEKDIADVNVKRRYFRHLLYHKYNSFPKVFINKNNISHLILSLLPYASATYRTNRICLFTFFFLSLSLQYWNISPLVGNEHSNMLCMLAV
ncbi:hypothetical protein L9F63_008871, partial [Diploptera punctata]